MIFFVYAYVDNRIRLTDDDFLEFEPIYIGRGQKTRHLDHLASAKRASTSEKCSIKDRFIFENLQFISVIKIFENLSFEESCDLEKYLIKKYGRKILNTGPLLNIQGGGQGHFSSFHAGSFNPFYGKTHSDANKKKMSAIHKGKKLSNETKSKISATLLGRKDTLTARENKKASLRRRFIENPNQPMFTVLGETKAKTYTIKDPSGNLIMTTSLRKFCLENGLNAKTLKSAFLKGKAVVSGGSAGWQIMTEH